MPHWKRIVLYSWALIVILLTGCWVMSFFRESYVGFALATQFTFKVATTIGSLVVLVTDAAGDPFHFTDFTALSTKQTWSTGPISTFGTLSLTHPADGISRLSLPFWLLIIFATLLFVLLFLLVHRRQSRKNARLHRVPSADN